MAEKLFVGARLRRLRGSRGWTLEGCASRLGLSPSYLSQIETNQRPVTARVLIALTQVFQVDAGAFDVGDEGRLAADLREATVDAAAYGDPPSAVEIKQAASATPALARQFLALHRAFRRLDERFKAMDETVSLDETAVASASLPYEEVRDFFHYKDNYVDALDTAAESLASLILVGKSQTPEAAMIQALLALHAVTVVRTSDPGAALRRFDPLTRRLYVDGAQPTPTRTFQLAHQLALLEFREPIEQELERARFRSPAARDVCRIGLANYAAGALILPYRAFLEAAAEMRHDVERLQVRFGASFEQVCHRLSCLQRPGLKGVPFYFVRIDMAGNITKRHSATRLQFARFGGACPLWNVHEAFGRPGDILTQVAETPDTARYLCMARSEVKRSGDYLTPDRRYALGLGCEIQHAGAVVYAAGLDLEGPAARIGISCRICERDDCPQRAFPPLDRALRVPLNNRRTVPYDLVEPGA
ncbi:short-chain fatty acyl-CoA regulator family protein [Caulobacter sp. S45]|uniref:helix-turn-helix domain-containing protein n=1 Tax=Caulobacter sp. S45 TaxID=1641861 RepID=UPI0015766E5C|nr:short-chain fatty acyl-CoA regulator family protein [Caulobacter sp. S45]